MIIAILIALGLCMGSFASATVWRLHEQAKPKKKRAASDKELSIVTGRSMCAHCHHTLGALDLLPVASWVWLRGKCRYCQTLIEDTPLPEVGLAALFVVSYVWWPLGFHGVGLITFGIWLLALVGFMILAVYDLRWLILPNKVVFPLIGLAAVSVLAQVVVYNGGPALLVRAIAGMLIGGGIFYVLYQLSQGRWIGGGDVKLGFGLGLLLVDPLKVLLMLFMASLLGTLLSLPLLYTRKLKKTSQVPFGPFLILATVIVQLFGAAMLDWYTRRLFSL